MPEAPREDEGLYKTEIRDAVARLNRKESQKPRGERREFVALGNAESVVFRAANAEAGLTHWYVIAADTTGCWYIAAPIQLKGFGLKVENARVFSRNDIEREEVIDQRSLSSQLGDALRRLGDSIVSLPREAGVAQNIERVRGHFSLMVCDTVLRAETDGGHVAFQIRQSWSNRSRWEREMADGEVIRIGRHPDNDLVLPRSNISRHHCEVKYEMHRWFARDCNSQNGTILNDARLGEQWSQA